jgi:hypothetical protein
MESSEAISAGPVYRRIGRDLDSLICNFSSTRNSVAAGQSNTLPLTQRTSVIDNFARLEQFFPIADN